MTTLLQLNASIQGDSGQSSQLANGFVAKWREQHPEGRVVRRDLAADPVPHLTAERFGAFLTPADRRSAEQQAIADYSDALVAEIQAADVVVIGLPMYNFGLPSQLKAYFDHIARAGITFKYSAQGPVGLLQGKTVYVFATRGGLYAGAPLDTQAPYVRDFLAFLGLKDVQFVFAEGLAIDAQKRDAALAAARSQIDALLETRAAA
jgi:FMN-dependent NADH-azoreductase